MMFKVKTIIMAFVSFMLCVTVSFSYSVKKTITGKVVDQDQSPVENALIILSASLQNTNSPPVSPLPLSTDSTYTDAKGMFTKELTVDLNAYGITYHILKDGWQEKSGYSLLTLLPSLDLGTLTLSQGTSKKITVSGTILDTATNQPIYNALVLLRTSLWVKKPDSAYTDTNGNFIKQLAQTWIDTSIFTLVLYYSVEKRGYIPKNGQLPIPSPTINLGKIFLKTLIVNITPHPLQISAQVPSADRMELYSLNGRLLYTGAVKNINTVLKSSSLPVIVCFKLNDKILYKTKRMLSR
jgi:hypothetical protein